MANVLEQVERLSPQERALLVQRLKAKKRSVEQRASIPRLPRQAQGNTFPLSFAQERMWFLDQLDGQNAVYSSTSALRIEGGLDPAILEKSLNAVIQRHEILRTTFVAIEGHPVQHVAPTMFLPLDVLDLSAWPKAQQEIAIRRLITDERRRPFDLEKGPLLRATLLRLDSQEHIFFLAVNHIVVDGWSYTLLVRELIAFYDAFSQGKTLLLAELPIQYADFAAWQRGWLQGSTLDNLLAYWKGQFNGELPVLELPTDRPRPAIQTFRGAFCSCILPAGLQERLQALSQKEGVTLFMTLLAAFQAVLSRYSGQTDILVGTPIAGRNRVEVEALIGFFINTLVLRTDLSGNPTFRELLKRVREVALGAYAHQDLPFEKLVDALRLQRNLSHSPIFQVMFILRNAPTENIQGAGFKMSGAEVESDVAQFDLTVVYADTEQGFIQEINYNTDLFDRETIERMSGHLQVLLNAVVADPDQRLADLPLLTEAERRQLLNVWNETRSEFPREKCLHELFDAQVVRTPDAPALVFDGQQMTYRELDARANQLAHHLRALGVGAESLVGVCLERSFDLVISLLAVLKAGGAYVPLDPEYPRDRLAYMLADARPTVLLTEAVFCAELPGALTRVVFLEDTWATIAKFPVDAPACPVLPDNPAYMIYTSGSTGRPKGAVNTHRGIVNRLVWMQATYPLNAADRVMQKTPFSFDVSVWEFFWPLITGATLVVAEPGGHKDPGYLARLIEREHITTIHFVPSMLQVFLTTDGLEMFCRSLRRVICSGEALPYELQERFYQQLSAELHNLYGPTEAAVDVTWWPCSAENERRLVPIGRPIANIQTYVLDAQLRPVPVGVPGELFLGGVGLARGYFDRPELTAEKFVPNPFSEAGGERLYRTGDVCRYLPDGNLLYLGRLDHQVKLRGFRIELGEIEVALGACAGVRECVVVARQDGSGDQRLVAYLVAESDLAPTATELRSALKERLPEYMLPAVYVLLEQLPLTPSGKVDRKALPAPEQSHLGVGVAYLAPQAPVEKLLADIWGQVLGLEQVGLGDNFFALGGHSLLATQVLARVRQVLGVELPLRSLFETATLGELAAQVAERQCAAVGVSLPPITFPITLPITPADRSGGLPLSFSQQRLWFLDRLEPGSAAYNLPAAVRLRGRLDIPALERSLNAIICRHESLRTTFTANDGQPVQVIAPAWALNLSVLDLAALVEMERNERVLNLAREQARRGFDLAAGPLIRGELLRLAKEEHVLLLTMHHIVADGWSIGNFIRELSTFYQAYATGQEISLSEGCSLPPRCSLPQRCSLPPLPIQYADYAVWQRGWLQGDVLETQLAYWKEKLANAAPVLDLPTDRPRPQLQSFNGAHLPVTLSPALTQALKAFARAEGATLFMTLLAAFQALLSRYSGQTDILVGTPIANRSQAQLENLIGLFINTLVLRTDLSGADNFHQLLQQVRETTLDAYAHQDLPFEMLVEALQLPRTLGHSPLFQVMFILQNTPQETLQLSGLELELLAVEQGMAKFDLTLSFTEVEQGLAGELEYNTDLFDRATVERMMRHFQALLAAAIAAPGQKLADLPLLIESERQQLLVAWNATQVEFSREKCLAELFEAQVTRTPDAPALVFAGQKMDYRELDARGNQLARFLRRLGVGPGTLVGISVERSLEMVVGLLGVLKAGGAYVPLDPAYPAERLAYMLQDAAPLVLLTQRHLLAQLPQGVARPVCLDADWPSIQQERTDRLPIVSDPHNLAYVIYTSGSTGRPKGVGIPQRAVVNFLESMKREPQMRQDDALLAVTTLSFDIAGLELFLPLTVGAQVLIASREMAADGVQLMDALAQGNITLMQATPATWRMLLAAGWQGTPGLKILCGGEALLRDLADALLERCDELWNLYGPTETTIWSSVGRVSRGDDAISIGKPIANTQLYVLDSRMNPQPVGVSGELYIGGAGLSSGYVGHADLTAEKFVPNPFSEAGGERLYRTGDVCRYLPDGNLLYLGRLDHQVKLRGFRIELGEIEVALGACAGVRECVVVARQDGSGDKRLVAYLVAESDPAPTATELRSALKERLPEYMLPSTYVFLACLPLTPSGKVDRKALPAPDATRSSLAKEFVSPRTPIEKQLAEIWIDVLKVEQVGIHDDFFELGGHSLLATQAISRIRKVFQADLPLLRIFETPTVAGIAQVIEQIQQAPVSKPSGIQRVSREQYRISSKQASSTPKAVSIRGEK